MARPRYIRLEGEILRLSNLDKALYPAARFSKGDVIDYYRRIAPVVLPHLRDRPFTLRRFPSGVGGQGFYEKQCPSHRPRWLRTGEFGGARYCLINDAKSLIWAANLAALELHVTLARIRDMSRPTALVFDLDPGPGAGLAQCAEVALLLRALLEPRGLVAFPKTSGSKGLHLYLPLNSGETWDSVTRFARAVAELLELRHPDRVTSKMARRLRSGKVFIDWSQNVDFKTTVCAWSLRATERPTVSTPLSWKEVAAAAHREDAAARLAAIDAREALSRAGRLGDSFAPVLSLRQSLPEDLRLPGRRIA
jgi:bifunctional non-homologous end joining protein LigD